MARKVQHIGWHAATVDLNSLSGREAVKNGASRPEAVVLYTKLLGRQLRRPSSKRVRAVRATTVVKLVLVSLCLQERRFGGRAPSRNGITVDREPDRGYQQEYGYDSADKRCKILLVPSIHGADDIQSDGCRRMNKSLDESGLLAVAKTRRFRGAWRTGVQVASSPKGIACVCFRANPDGQLRPPSCG